MTADVPQSLLGRLSFVLGKLHLRSLDLETEALAPTGLDVKQHAVLTLLTADGPMTQQRLGQRLGIDRTTVISVVDALERQELVWRQRCPADRRAYQITPTPAGHDRQRRGQQLLAHAEQTLLGALDEPERRTLQHLLARALSGEERRRVTDLP